MRYTHLPLAALVLSGSLMFAASPSSPDTSRDTSRLLGEVRSIAFALNRDAATLESYKGSGISWQGHAYRLNLAREHINSIAEKLETLQAMKASAAPWQQEAIDSIVPVAAKLASSTQAAIVHLNDNRGQLFTPAYTDHVSAIAENANRMHQSVDVFLDAAGTEQKLDSLRDRATALRS